MLLASCESQAAAIFDASSRSKHKRRGAGGSRVGTSRYFRLFEPRSNDEGYLTARAAIYRGGPRGSFLQSADFARRGSFILLPSSRPASGNRYFPFARHPSHPLAGIDIDDRNSRLRRRCLLALISGRRKG